MSVDALYKEGKEALQANDVAAAVSKFETVVSLEPAHDRAYHFLAEIKLSQGDADTALAYAQKAVGAAPEQAAHYNQLGLSLMRLGRLSEAERAFGAAVARNPDLYVSRMNMGVAQVGQEKYLNARKTFESLIQVRPDDAAVLSKLGPVLAKLGRIDDALECLDKAWQLDPNSFECANNRLRVLNYGTKYSLADVWAQTKCYWSLVDRKGPRQEPYTHLPDTAASPKSPLRVGYVSADFRIHPVGLLFKSVLQTHDPNNVFPALYSNNTVEDDITVSLKTDCALWRNISGLTDSEAAQIIHEDKIDILVDLSSYTDGGRLKIFKQKPAPLQMTWLGFVATTALKEIDYIVADNHVLPPEHEPYYAEQPARLPHCLWCFAPPKNAAAFPQTRPSQMSPVTFGCFNSISKINADLVKTWSRILDQVPDSRLLIKYAYLSDADLADSVQEVFADNGIRPERLTILGKTSYEDHMAAYNTIDVALDSFPYNGTMTTLESLWMGVPVITRCGNTWASRVGKSLLSTIGLDEFVTASEGDYIERAVSLANDTSARAHWHGTLRQRLESSPVCDVTGFTRNLERLYHSAWTTWCSSA